MKNIKFILLLTLLIIISSTTVVIAEVELPDIEDHWAEDFIRELVDIGAITGYPDGLYRPENRITRAEFASVLRGVLELKEVKGETFSDTFDHWGEGRIEALIKEGIIDTDLYEGNYSPDGYITREEIAMMTVRMLGDESGATETPFLDEGAIGDGYNAYVAEAYEKGIITGYPDTTFRPAGTATRAEAAVMVIRGLNVKGVADDFELPPSDEADQELPTIVGFSGEPSIIKNGESSTLNWEVIGADDVSIDPNIGEVGLKDSISISPEETTKYTLTASNNIGTTTGELTVDVFLDIGGWTPPSYGFIVKAPEIISFAIDKSMMTEGIGALLNWEVTGVATVTIEPDIGEVELTGSEYVYPTEDTTYTLTAYNNSGTAVDTETISVEPAMKIQPGPGDGYDITIYSSGSSPSDSNLSVGTSDYFKEFIFRSLMWFDLEDIPDDAVIVYGYLTTYQYAKSRPYVEFDINAHVITNSWEQNSVSIKNSPTFIMTPEATSPSTETTWRNWDIKSLLQGWVDGSIENYGLMLKKANENEGEGLGNLYMNSSEHKDNPHLRPQLNIRYFIP